MKITLIDPTGTIINYGLRALAQTLLNAGHEVRLLFMNQQTINYNYNYSKQIYSDLWELVEGSDLAGFFVLSNFLGQAEKLTGSIKNNLNIPVIWGGIHATACPDKSLDYADFVCIGEGEKCLTALLDKLDSGTEYLSTPNLCYKLNGQIIKNPLAVIDADIDSYSMPLYDNQKEFVRYEDRIVQMNNNIRMELTGYQTNYYHINEETTYPYLTMASRGCPNSCCYCCNNLVKNIYRGKGKLLRRRANEQVIRELESALEKMPFINLIELFDDDFIFPNEETISEFADLYKKRIGLPFRCNFRPDSVSQNKIDCLKDAGLISVEIGLQSASLETNKLFNRKFNRQKFLSCSEIVNRNQQITVKYDLIVDNPFEKNSDVIQTLRFISLLPEPFDIAVYSLTFFPGTTLYNYAQKKKIFTDFIKEIVEKKNFVQYEFKDPFIKFLFLYIRRIGFNNPLKKKVFNVLTSKIIFTALNSFLFFPLWSSFLFAKRAASSMRNKGTKLFPG